MPDLRQEIKDRYDETINTGQVINILEEHGLTFDDFIRETVFKDYEFIVSSDVTNYIEENINDTYDVDVLFDWMGY